MRKIDKSLLIQIFSVSLNIESKQNQKVMNGERCQICNSLLSENNTTGIGFGCTGNIVIPAKTQTFWKVNSLEWYVYKATKTKDLFLKSLEGRKFRSEFKIKFYESMKQAERISKKQLDIMVDMLKYEFFQEIQKMEEENKSYLEKWMNSFNSHAYPEIYEPIFTELKNKYLRKRKTKNDE